MLKLTSNKLVEVMVRDEGDGAAVSGAALRYGARCPVSAIAPSCVLKWQHHLNLNPNQIVIIFKYIYTFQSLL